MKYDGPYNTTNNPITCTSGVIANKDAAHNQAVATTRIYVRNEGVSDQQKLDLVLYLDDTTPTPIPAPVTVPLLTMVLANPSQHTRTVQCSLSSHDLIDDV